jgi:hypothetical protein
MVENLGTGKATFKKVSSGTVITVSQNISTLVLVHDDRSAVLALPLLVENFLAKIGLNGF